MLILKSLNIADPNCVDMYIGGKHLFKIGYETNYGKEILEQQWNEYILLGVVKRDKKYNLNIQNEDEAIKILKAMNMINEIDEKLLELLIKLADKIKSEQIELELLRVIANNSDLIINEKYKK